MPQLTRINLHCYSMATCIIDSWSIINVQYIVIIILQSSRVAKYMLSQMKNVFKCYSLQDLYKSILLSDLGYALEKKVEQEL